MGIMRIICDMDVLVELSFTDTALKKINEPAAGDPSASSPVIQKCIKQLDEYFSGSRRSFDLDLLPGGTPFQQSVWSELQKITYGRTISYLTLSKRLGNVKAIRAVGTANGRNPIAIIVPCHRVIGSNGALVGYAGDIWRKKWLLGHEAKYANGVQMLFSQDISGIKSVT